MDKTSQKKILIAPLDWGLGHATRCIPIINELLHRNADVSVATSGNALTLLRSEFPSLSFFEITSYGARYSRRWPFMLHLLFQLPRFLAAIYREHAQLKNILKNRHFDLLISDNRYGVWSKNVRSIFITHQVNIIMPPYLVWTRPIVDFFNHRQIKKFHDCWVPDWPDSRLTKKLTTPSLLALQFVGPLSRFTKHSHEEKRYNIVALISGPEPQRSELESLLSSQLENSAANFLIVRGRPGATDQTKPRHVNHLNKAELELAVSQADIVISRSGYSTVMDLMALGAKAIFIPTPGQTEQEFLAEELQRQKIAYYQKQSEFDLARALTSSKSYVGFAAWRMPPNLLTSILDTTLKELK